MKKGIVNLIVIAVAFLLVVIGCSYAIGGGDDKGEKEAKNITQDTQTATSSEASDAQSEESAANNVLYDEGGIKISLKKFDTSILGTELNLAIENNTDQDLILRAEDVSVNGYMVTALMSTDVGAGKKANGKLTVFDSSLEDNEITEIEEVEFKIKIENSDYDVLNTVGPFTVAAK